MKNSVSDLVALRQWLVQIADSVPREYSRKAYDGITELDNILWKIIIGGKSPWESTKRYSSEKITVSDPEFKKTIQQLKEGTLDVRRIGHGNSEQDSYENS